MSESNTQQTEEPIEVTLAYWLSRFEGTIEYFKDSQLHIHECITSMEGQCFTEEQKKVAEAVLNDALALSFIVKNYSEPLKQFINYQTKR